MQLPPILKIQVHFGMDAVRSESVITTKTDGIATESKRPEMRDAVPSWPHGKYRKKLPLHRDP